MVLCCHIYGVILKEEHMGGEDMEGGVRMHTLKPDLIHPAKS